MNWDIDKIKTLGALNKAGYQSKPVKEEMRDNLVEHLKEGRPFFNSIKGYDETVIPQIETAILSRHNMILLGLRGQAKTRLARLATNLLDEYMPVVEGSEMQDDPLRPLSKYARDLVSAEQGNTPITWVHRDERFTEKLATPDVSVADLIGDVDPIKAATLKLPYSDERVIHFGLIPRAHRGVFVINELPDLQARIQVALFNILQEGDIQIRGFKVRMPLDIQFIFTANPEDYTNRGSIVTPLKDRIDSQILTHYPQSIDISREITNQEAKLTKDQQVGIEVYPLLKDLIELIAFKARESDLIDQKSGVSARLTISALENLYSSVERRGLKNKEKRAIARISDLFGVLPAITGKVELVYEGELEGVANVAYNLIGKAVRDEFAQRFPNPEKVKKSKSKNPFDEVVQWFTDGNVLDMSRELSEKDYKKQLQSVKGLSKLITNNFPEADEQEQNLLMEFTLFGLAEFSQISRHNITKGVQFKDLMSSMFSLDGQDEDDIEDHF